VETFLNVRALAAGLRIVEVASFESPRIHGDSHLRTFRDGSRVLRTIARERRRLTRARSGLGVPRPHARYSTSTHRTTAQLIEEETHTPILDTEATVPLQRLLVAAGSAKPALLHEPAALHEAEG
jgi:hypothetical protein